MKLELEVKAIERVITDQGNYAYAVHFAPILLTTSEWYEFIGYEKHQRVGVRIDGEAEKKV